MAVTRLLAVVVAAASVGMAVAAPVGAATTTRYAIPGTSATIAVPASWTALERRTLTNSAAFRRFIDQNPALQPFAQQMAGANSPIKLMVFDVRSGGRFVTNANVVLSGPSGGLTPSRAAAVYGRELRAQLSVVRGPVTTSVVRLPSGPAVRASYKANYTSNGRTFTVQTIQYLVLRRDNTVVVTFSTAPAEAARRNATFTAMARSLRFGA